MHWIHLSAETQLTDALTVSYDRPVIIFKHSTRCSISSMALNRMEKQHCMQDADFYFVDVIAHRDISNKIAETLKVHHESPQILLIKSGDCVYTESHNGITCEEIREQISLLQLETAKNTV